MKYSVILLSILFTSGLISQSRDDIQNKILNQEQINVFLKDTINLRNLRGIDDTACDFAKCIYNDNFFDLIALSLKKNFPNLVIRDKTKIMMDLYSPDEKFYLSFGGDEFDRKKNVALKDEIEEFLEKQFFSYIFCFQKFNPVYEFDSGFFLFRIFENIHSRSDEFLRSADSVEIPISEDKAERLRKNPNRNAIVCKFKLDVQTKTESHGIGLIYQIIETDCGILDLVDEKFYVKSEDKPAK